MARWKFVAGAVAGLALAAGLTAVLDDARLSALLGKAVGPVAVAPSPEADDGAGDAGGADDFSLPIPTPLTDESVVAAFAPLVPLACTLSDYGDGTAAAPTAAAVYVAAESEARERALASPLAPASAEVDALMTQTLIGAALSPVASFAADELPAPVSVAATGAGAGADASCPTLLNHTFNRLQTGEPQSLCQFQGKVLLIVNTASYCGNTPQYEGLEALYRKYKDRGLVVIGFPSNDFGAQEPGTNKEIAEFCRTTYGVQFPMYEKSSVAKTAANPLFVELIAKTGSAPRWNFHKYVVDRTGAKATSFSDSVKPEARQIVDLIERLLDEKAPPAAAAKG